MIVELPPATTTSSEARVKQHAQRRRDRRLWSPTQRARWRAQRQAQLRQLTAHYRRMRGQGTTSVDV
jgi:hypothetical protein